MIHAPQNDIFGNGVSRYDMLVDWERRLANEAPFYRRLFREVGARRMLDVACGTGRHAAMFHEWGLQVEGADVSPKMLAVCRERYGESESLRWVERSFDTAWTPRERFHVAICVGNSLCLAPSRSAADTAIRVMANAVSPGGICVVQVLNLWRFPEGPTIWEKCKRFESDGGQRILLKGIRRIGSRGFVDLVDLVIGPDGVTNQSKGSELIGLEADDVCSAFRKAGASCIEVFGGYNGETYDRENSRDLTVVCRR